MASKTVRQKWRSSMFVISAYRIHKDVLLDGVVDLARSPDGVGGESGPRPTFFFQPAVKSAEETRAASETFLDHIFDTQEHRAEVMVVADHAKLGELDTEILERLARPRIANEARTQYIRQRDAFVNLYDPETARRAGFETNVESDPLALMFQVRRAVDGLLGGRVELAESFGGVTIDAATYGKAMEPTLRRLQENMRQINFDLRSTQSQLRLKNEAMRAHDAIFGPAARCLEAAFLMAGLPEFAERVKPSLRRPGRREDEVIAEEDGGPPAPGFEVLGIEEPPLPIDDEPAADPPAAEEPAAEEPPSNG